MYIWISKKIRISAGLRRSLALFAFASLAACGEDVQFGSFPAMGFASPGQMIETTPPISKRSPKAVGLAGGRVVVSGPDGYCVDKDSVTTNNQHGFAILASCEVLSGEVGGLEVDPVILTVTVQPEPAAHRRPGAAELAAAAAPSEILEKIETESLTLVHLSGGSSAGLRQSDPKHWRGALLINGQLVALALYVGKGSALAGRAGQVLMRQVARRLTEGSVAAKLAPATQ